MGELHKLPGVMRPERIDFGHDRRVEQVPVGLEARLVHAHLVLVRVHHDNLVLLEHGAKATSCRRAHREKLHGYAREDEDVIEPQGRGALGAHDLQHRHPARHRAAYRPVCNRDGDQMGVTHVLQGNGVATHVV